MELTALIHKQVAADQRHGFPIDFADDDDRLTHLERDIVGLVGEVGEFANLLKKVRLAATHDAYDGPSLSAASAGLRDELADIAIYLMRLSVMLGDTLEADILAKMDVNEQRYGELRQ